MADRYAVANGNWSDTATWDGGTLPGASDDVYADGFTVTIDQDVTVLSIRTTQRSGGTNGGLFDILTPDLSITADFHKGANATVLRLNVAGNLAVVGNTATNESGSSTYFLNNIGNGSIDWTGNITAGGANSRHGIRLQSGTIVVTGDVTGGSSANAYGIFVDGGSVTINGDAIADIGPAVGCDSINNTVVVNGDLRPSAVAPAVTMYDASNDRGDLILNGNIIDHSSGQSPTHFGKLLIHASDELAHTYRTDDSGTPGVARSLYTGGTNLGQPVEADVRSGTTFGASSEYTGSLAVPDPSYVSQGVPTDDTVGTMAPAAADWTDTEKEQIRYRLGIDGTESAPATNTDQNLTVTLTASERTAIRSEIDSNSTQLAAILEDTGTTIPGLIDSLSQFDKRVAIATSTAFEIPDAGTVDYQIEVRTKDADGNLANATVTPTLTVTHAGGDLSGNLSAATNPSTGVYRWQYTVASTDTSKQIWVDVSAAMADGTFTGVVYSALTDAEAVDFTSADRTNLSQALTAINELLTDWQDGGRLDNSLDAKASQASVDGVPAGVRTELTAELGKIDVAVSTRSSHSSPDINAELINYFETLTRAKGSLPVLRVLELIQAAVMGLSDEPAAGQERYQFADGTNAFTVQFDANNFRTAITLH
jgi:hypothetical protein